jgi:hypothetical protein
MKKEWKQMKQGKGNTIKIILKEKKLQKIRNQIKSKK